MDNTKVITAKEGGGTEYILQPTIFDPTQFEHVQRVATSFVNSKLVPEMYQYKPTPIPAGANEQVVAKIQAENKNAYNTAVSNCLIALNMANRIGVDPIMMMQNLDIIYGRPAFRSTFLIASINSCGRYKPLRFTFTDKGTIDVNGQKVQNLECYAYTTERGSDEVLKGSPCSIQMAVMQGWYGRSGSKWPSMPEQMLMYRAAAFWQRIYAPDVSIGFQTVDEVYDSKAEVVDVHATPIEEINMDE